MRPCRAFRSSILRAVLPAWLLIQTAAHAETGDPAIDHAVARYNDGDPAGAAAEMEAYLQRQPDDISALFFSSRFAFEDDRLDVARARLERVIKRGGNYADVWELMVQIAQAQGDLARRDQAVEQAKVAIATAIDPQVRRRDSFVRDRFHRGGKVIVGVEYFARAGNEFTRFHFAVNDPRPNQGLGLLLRTDEATTAHWAETALLPPDKLLFHLDMVDSDDNGGEKIAIYQYYAGEPDYDIVRAAVLRILRGEVPPLSGDPGSLDGILKP